MFSIKHPPKYTQRNKNRRQKAIIRKRKVLTLTKAIVAAWKDFCTTSSFVGFRYIYYEKRTTFDM